MTINVVEFTEDLKQSILPVYMAKAILYKYGFKDGIVQSINLDIKDLAYPEFSTDNGVDIIDPILGGIDVKQNSINFYDMSTMFKAGIKEVDGIKYFFVCDIAAHKRGTVEPDLFMIWSNQFRGLAIIKASSRDKWIKIGTHDRKKNMNRMLYGIQPYHIYKIYSVSKELEKELYESIKEEYNGYIEEIQQALRGTTKDTEVIQREQVEGCYTLHEIFQD